MTSQTVIQAREAEHCHSIGDPPTPTHVKAALTAYMLGSDPSERARLHQQAADLLPHARALLDHVALPAGGRALDLGCGPCGVLELLAERVGPGGQVIGLDCNPIHVALARTFAHEQGLANVEVVEGDARHTALSPATFDLVHARLLLVNIPGPQEVVAEMVRLARPGGWVVGLEGDLTAVCYPAHPASDRLYEIISATYRADGADVHIGRRLPELWRAAGLEEVGVEARADVYPAGHPRRTIMLDLVRSMRAKILERELAGERELDEVMGAVRDHLADPRTLVMPHLSFLVWGRKPPA